MYTENIQSLNDFMKAVQTRRMNYLSFDVKFYKDTQTIKTIQTRINADDYDYDCITVSTQDHSHTEYLVNTLSHNQNITSILTSLARVHNLTKDTKKEYRYYCNVYNLLDVLQSIQKQLPVINVVLDKLLYIEDIDKAFDKLETELNRANILAKVKANARDNANKDRLGLEWNERGQNPNANARAQAEAPPRGWNDGGGRKKTYTVAILKEKLRKQGKAVSGTKAELEKRLSL